MTTDGFRTAFLQPEKLQGDIRGRIIIATDIKTVRAEFGIKAPMVTHNVSYMVSCAALLPDLFTHVRCFRHTLQLPIRQGWQKGRKYSYFPGWREILIIPGNYW